MRKITKTMYKARKVVADCKPNDPVDIRCGGPHWLGFDFFVDVDTPKKKVETFVRETLVKYGHDSRNLYVSHARDAIDVEKLWTFPMIEECIKETQF